MVYQVTDSWHTNAVGNPQQWVNALINHGVNPDEANKIVQAYITYFPLVGLNYDFGLAQGTIEAAWFTSKRWVDQRNPCGLGITADDVAGPDFPSIGAGISAHAAHLCCYVYLAADCPIEKLGDGYADLFNDPRHAFHDGMDKVQDLERPGRRWAVPGDGYTDKIVNIANTVTANQQPKPTPIGGAKRLGDLNIDWSQQTQVNVFGANGYTWPGRAASPVRAIVCHVMDGTYDGSIAWANNPVSQASFNFGVAQDGRLACVVDPRGAYAPWANAVMNPGTDKLPDALADLRDGTPNANYVTVSIEHEGHPFDANFPTAQQLNASVELCAALMLEYNLDASRDTITGHFQYDPIGRANCPGPNFNLDAYTARVQALLSGHPDHAPTVPTITLNGHTIAYGFLSLWQSTNRPYQVFGIPTSDEQQATIIHRDSGEQKPVTIQRFDRAIMVHDSSIVDPMWQDTTLQDDWVIKGG